LVVQREFFARQRAAQIEFERAAPAHPSVHFGFEESIGVAAFALGSIEREIRDPQQLFRVQAVVGRDRDADAGADRNLVSVDVMRLADRLDHAHRQRFGVRRLAKIGLENSEFIAAESRDHVMGGANACAQTLRHAFQDSVADRMAERVVHRLEAVEVDAMHREGPAMAPAVGEGALQLLAEDRAVAEIGQRVVVRHVGDARLGAPPFRHVLQGRDPAAPLHRSKADRDCSTIGEFAEHRDGLSGGHCGADHFDLVLRIHAGIATALGEAPEDFGIRRA
jgi:hypothetical protein